MVYIPQRQRGDNKAGFCFYGDEGSAGGEQSSAGMGDAGGNGGEGSGAQDGGDGGIASLPVYNPPNQYLSPADVNIETLPMGGTPNPYPYQTRAPDYNDLKAKHTAGYTNPATKDRSTPDLFNFDGTVYQYQPDNNTYRDTYSGTIISANNDNVGSRGIEDLYGSYVENAYLPQSNSLQMAGSNAKRVNPAYDEYLADYEQQTADYNNRLPTPTPWTSISDTSGNTLQYDGRTKDNVPEHVGVKDWIYNQGGPQVMQNVIPDPVIEGEWGEGTYLTEANYAQSVANGNSPQSDGTLVYNSVRVPKGDQPKTNQGPAEGEWYFGAGGGGGK